MSETAPELIDELQDARAREKAQTLFYRALASDAEAAGDAELAERLNGLLADEQHHLSRLTARLLELGEAVEDPRGVEVAVTALGEWEPTARAREEAEVERYVRLRDAPASRLDDATRALIEEILRTERHHAKSLRGKWTPA